MPCYEAVPDGTNDLRGGVVVQEALGVTSHIDHVTRRFVDAGVLVAVAPHLFHRTGDPAFSYDDISLVITHMMALTDAGVLADVRLALEHLHGAGFDDRQMAASGSAWEAGSVSW